MRFSCLAAVAALLVAGPVAAQTSEWREVASDNLLVIETTKGRVLIEMAPQAAPLHVERIRTLVRRGFYDGITFHRVMPGFMAQTGDPQGDGQGSSELPDLQAEFAFRRPAEPGFGEVTGSDTNRPGATTILGLYGSLPVQTQPDAQMFITRDGSVDASTWFCPGVIGAARTASDVNSSNSQFFIMTAANTTLNGQYTAWGRVVGPMDAVNLLQSGDASTGAVPVDRRDSMVRARIASDIPEGERPSVRVLDTRSARFQALVAETRTARGSRFSVCDIILPAEVTN